jgi:hypothetical protein
MNKKNLILCVCLVILVIVVINMHGSNKDCTVENHFCDSYAGSYTIPINSSNVVNLTEEDIKINNVN